MEEAKTARHNKPKKGLQHKNAVKCFVPTCNSKMGSVSRRMNVTFHNFPKNQSIYLKWKRAIHNEDEPSDASKVCSLHFQEDDYRCKCPSLRKVLLFLLKEKAVPSLNLPVRLPSARCQTRYQTRLATGPTEVSNESKPTGAADIPIKVEDTSEETPKDERSLSRFYEALALNEDGSIKDLVPPKIERAKRCEAADSASTVHRKKQRRKLYFSSNKLKNRLKRIEWRRGRALGAGQVSAKTGGGGDLPEKKAARPTKTCRSIRNSFAEGGSEGTAHGRRRPRLARTSHVDRTVVVPETSLDGTSKKSVCLRPALDPDGSASPLKSRFKNASKNSAPLESDGSMSLLKSHFKLQPNKFVALKMDASSSSLMKSHFKVPPKKSRVGMPFIDRTSETLPKAAEKRKPHEERETTQTCCVPGCTTRHKPGPSRPVFSFPTDPSWKERWSKSIFGAGSVVNLQKQSSKSVPMHRTVATTRKDGSKIFVHHRQLKMPMAAYRALFTIPGWGRPHEETAEDATVVIDQRRVVEKKSMVCSFHFQDGKPTAKNPIPKLNLGAERETEKGVEVRPAVHEDHTYAAVAAVVPSSAVVVPCSVVVVPSSADTQPNGEHELPTPPKQSTDVTPTIHTGTHFHGSPFPELPTPPSEAAPDEEIVIRRKGERTLRPKPPDEAGRKKIDHKDHTYAAISEHDDYDKSDHTYAFVISGVKNSESAIWGQYSVSPLAQACYTTGTETFTEDQDLFYATVKQEPEEEDDDSTPSPLVADRCFASDWEQSPIARHAVKQEPPDHDSSDPFASVADRVKSEPPECGSFHFVDVGNFVNDYRSDFEDLGSLDSLFAAS